ncbi:serine/threonine-protein kinase [Hyalangium minutum]|nr:serine/threonine-protein kinase [Hyalangium minutum]
MSHSAKADIKVGTILRDTYELTSLLGKGGMGSVFLARHLRLPGKQVAVKVLLHSDDLTEEQYARFRREAEIASQLGHPNIVEVVDFHSLEDGTPYLVMEYLRGESLAHRLRKGRMSLREAFSIARQMGSALQAAHRAGVVHRDLKPANVHLVPTDSEGMIVERVKLLDFGISKLMGSQTLQTQEDVLMGTPRYMAPEQAMGRNREVDARSDIFAFGCIVYEMLCGDSPFAGGTIAEVVYRVVHEQPESLASRVPDLPGRAVAAVDRALAKQPKDRYQDVATFIAELTGTALQSLAGLGPDPTPMPPRGAARQSEPSLDENATDATFVPSRLDGTGQVGALPPAAAAALATPDPSLEKGSTLEAFRMATPQPAAQQVAPASPPSMSVSRRPTDMELPAVGAAAVQPAAPTPAPQAQPQPVPTPAPASAPAGRSKFPLIPAAVAGVVLVGILAVVGGKVFKPSTPDTPPPTPVAETPPPEVKPPVVAEPTPPAPTAPPATTPPATTPPGMATSDTAPPVTTPPATATGTTKPTARPGKAENIPPELREELDKAEQALSAGQLDDALRIAQRTLRTQKTEAALLVMGRVYCQRHDVGNVNAQRRQLSADGQRKLTAYCRKYEN